MTDEAATNPSEGVAEPQTQPEIAQGDQSEIAQAADEQASSTAETEGESDETEVEYEGKAYKVPKELKDALLRQADYTRKTQEAAEAKRAAEAEREASKAEIEQQRKLVELQRANVRAYGQLTALDSQLQQYQQTDWQALSTQDPIAAQQQWFQYAQLKEYRQQVAGQIAQAEQQAQSLTQQEIAKRLDDGQKVLARDIKGWSPEVAKQVRDFGLSHGYTVQEIDAIHDPRVVKALHKAMLYDNLMKTAQAKPAANQAPAEPVKKVSGGTVKSTTNPDKMNTDEWLRWRENQIKSKRQAR